MKVWFTVHYTLHCVWRSFGRTVFLHGPLWNELGRKNRGRIPVSRRSIQSYCLTWKREWLIAMDPRQMGPNFSIRYNRSRINKNTPLLNSNFFLSPNLEFTMTEKNYTGMARGLVETTKASAVMPVAITIFFLSFGFSVYVLGKCVFGSHWHNHALVT